MWLKYMVFFGIFAILLIGHRTSGQDYGPCTNPRGDRGRCINIRTCRPLLNLLHEATPGSDVRAFLQRSVCTYENKDPVVCCPTPSNNNNNGNGNNIGNDPPINGNNNNGQSSRYGPLTSPVCGYTDAKFTRIVNGVPAKLGAWPWAALLGYRSRKNPNKPAFRCGGALISARHVLTAGHCVYNQGDLYVVRLGELVIDDDNDGASPIDVFIERKDIHPEYSPNRYTSDVAVLRLAQEVQFSDLLKPICLPITEDIQSESFENAWPYVVGWGSVYFNGPTAPHLQQLQLPLVEEDQCRQAYRGTIAKIDGRVLCAGLATGGKDACQGDSGGPMMYPIGKTWYSIGVVSYGFKCAYPGYPGVYSKTQTFLDFILSHLD